MDIFKEEKRLISASAEPLVVVEKPKKSEFLRTACRYGAVLVGGALLTTAILLITAQLASMKFQRSRGLNSRLSRFGHLSENAAFNDNDFDRHLLEFSHFLTTFEKEYESLAEEKERFEHFRINLRQIEELNLKRTDSDFGVNEFSDMSEAEFKNMLLPLDFYQNLRSNATFIRKMNPLAETASMKDYPTHFDWREKGVVTPVKAQGNCGSCWAFATAATVECAYAIAHKELRSLSEQELLDCNLANNACNGGDVDKAFRFVHENGLSSEDAYPYVAHRQNSCSIAGQVTKIDVAYFLNPTELSIIDWLVNFGPVNIGISVPPDMKPYTGGIYNPTPYDCKFRVVGLHALLIVGYGETPKGEKYWLVKNSWGQKWGIEDGYVKFARGVNACGIEDEPVGILA